MSGSPKWLKLEILKMLHPVPFFLSSPTQICVFFHSFAKSDKLKLFWSYFADHFTHITFCPDLLQLEISPPPPQPGVGWGRKKKKRISDDWNGFLFTVAAVVRLIRAVEVIVGTPILFSEIKLPPSQEID